MRQANTVPDGPSCAPDGNECTRDVCGAGVCTHPAEPAGHACGSPGETDGGNPDTCAGPGTCPAKKKPDGTAGTTDGNEGTRDVCGAGGGTQPAGPAGP